MGLFLSASGVVTADGGAVLAAIESYVAETGGTFELRPGTTNDRDIGVISAAASTATVLYPEGFSDWDELSRFLSQRLKTPVFSFHIHDGDLWMFIAFDRGDEVARFNPIPDYWDEIEDAERAHWAGDAKVVASLVPGITAASVERYFIPWTEETVTSEGKAYADDEFAIGVDWQLTDFMRRLGFAYPLDQQGKPIGETFYLKTRRPRQAPSAAAVAPPRPNAPSPSLGQPTKPWWRIW